MHTAKPADEVDEKGDVSPEFILRPIRAWQTVDCGRTHFFKTARFTRRHLLSGVKVKRRGSRRCAPMGKTWLSFLANYMVVVPFAFVLLSLGLRKRWVYDIADGLAGSVATIGLVKLAGWLHYQTRPFETLHRQPLIDHVADNSFPSDHLAAIGLAVAYLWIRSKPLALAGTAVAAVVGATRVHALLHWPGDIIAGFCLGLCGMVVAHLAIGRALELRGVSSRT